MAKFELSKNVINLSLALTKEVSVLDLSTLTPEERDFIFSQLKKTIGILSNIILKYDK